tara:strand:- start:4546 stop:4842 length:297 start_codon:yes stop_codon:yes gene_type:complete
MNTFLTIILSNFVFYVLIRINLVKKFRNSYSIWIKDGDGNRQTLSDTIAYLIEQNQIQEKRIMYLVDEIEQQWLNIEQIKTATGTERFCSDREVKNRV